MLHLLRGKEDSPGLLRASDQYLGRLTSAIENLRIYPRKSSYRDLVLLALYDKVLVTSRAVVALSLSGFADQAFALSRIAIEGFLALRYVENKDSEARAKRYIEFFAKDRERLLKLIAKHHPNLSEMRPPDYEKLIEMAKQFRSPHKWFPENSLKEVAYEESTWACDSAGDPQDWEYAYDVVYNLTSHEIHVTSVATEIRIAEFLQNSNYPDSFKFSRASSEAESSFALVNACLYAHAATEHLFHAFQIKIDDINAAFSEWAKVAGVKEYVGKSYKEP